MKPTSEHKSPVGDDGELIEADRNVDLVTYSEYVQAFENAEPNRIEVLRNLVANKPGLFAVAIVVLVFVLPVFFAPQSGELPARTSSSVPISPTSSPTAIPFQPDARFNFTMPQQGRSLFFGYGIQAVQRVKWSPDGQQLALLSDGDLIRTWYVSAENRNLPLYDHISHVDWLPDSHYLVMVKNEQATHIVSGYTHDSPTHPGVTGDTEVQPIIAVESGPPQLLASSAAGLIAFVTVKGEYLSILDLDQGEVIYNTRFSQPIRDIGWSSDGKQLLIVTDQGIWNWTSEKSAALLLSGKYYRAVWSPDAQKIAATAMLDEGNALRAVAVIDISEENVKQDVLIPLSDAYSGEDSDSYVQWSPTGNYIATSYKFNSAIDLWNSSTGDRVVRYDHPESVYSIDWSPDGRYIAIGSLAGVTIWSPLLN